VFVVGTLAFLGIRAFFVPHSFGEYGHYRGDAIAEIAALPIVHAGHETCETCHTDVLELKTKGKHAGVACEACHGPQAKHTEDPVSIVPVLPDAAVLCPQCHEASAAKPRWFPQVDTKEHSGGLVCKICHSPHNPGMTGDSK
jgi:uncharacterized CHY-type Zn-finger protein